MFLCVLLLGLILKNEIQVESARILGIFPTPSKSHYALGNVLLKELARRGHEVTMISPFEEKHPPPNSSYRDIKLEFEISEADKSSNFFSSDMSNPYLVTLFLNYVGCKMLNATLNFPNVQKLLESEEKFDAVIMDQFVDDGFSYFAHRFGANNILVSTTTAKAWVNPLVGNPAPPSVVADLLLNFPNRMNFLERLQNTIFYLYSVLNIHLYFFPQQNKIIKENLPEARPLYDYLYNVSLVLINTHESYTDPSSMVPVMKNVGGYHVSPAKKLPEDLQKFMDDSKEGVVYFSMGSNLKSKDMPKEVIEAIIRVFAKLKIKILWKWEDDSLPGQPPNLKLSKWLPQQEILGKCLDIIIHE
ncbi:hypothetical protein HHI36_007748 [Cryptolaemus montrouzieri]|uniref:UDP-glucuronosyltransferase n=1 Tax=Cryptolaemus montrouzieri TaxID=559131 RepID=A0ABD2MQD7_9CUCU